MALSEEKMRNSERAYDVLRQIYLRDEATPSRVAEELGSSVNSLRRYFKALESQNFVEFAKDGRKKIYSVDFEELYKYWQETISDLVTGGPMPGVNQSMLHNIGIEEHEFASKMSDISISLQKKSEEDNFFNLDFMSSYFEDYFTDNEESIIENFLIHDFVEGLRRARFTYLDNPFEGINVDRLEEWEKELLLSSFVIELNYLNEYEPDRSDSLLDALRDYEQKQGRAKYERKI